MVDQIRKKELLIPLILGITFSSLYHFLSLKYTLLGIIALIGLIVILYDIKIGLMAGVFLLPFLPDMLILLYMFFLMGVYFYGQSFKKSTSLNKNPIHMPIILFFIVIIISTATSINPVGSFRDFALHLGGLSFLFVMVNTIDNKEDFNKVVTLLVFSAAIVGLYGLYQYVVGVEVEAAWLDVENNPNVRTRVYSVFNNPNILAEYLVFIIPLSVSLLWTSKRLSKKIIFSATTMVMSLALLLTLSRGGWLGFAFAALIFIILVEKKLLLSLIPISLGAVYLLPETIVNRILSIGNLTDSSNAYRIKMWSITVDIIKDNWLAGVGFGHLPFKQTYETYIRTMPIFHSHNTYLQTAAEIGIPGLVAFLLFLFVLFKYGIKNLIGIEDKYISVMAAGALSALGGVLLHGMVENVLYLPKIIITFWILVSLVLTLIRIQNQKKEIS